MSVSAIVAEPLWTEEVWRDEATPTPRSIAKDLETLTTPTLSRILPLIEALVYAARMCDAAYAAHNRRLLGE